MNELFFLLSALLTVQLGSGQQPTQLPTTGVRFYLPYIHSEELIPDYSMIKAGDFYNIDQNNDHNNINDALWCQSANSSSNIGVWYYPNGTQVPLTTNAFNNPSNPSPVFSKRFSGQIALARKSGLAGYEGLYKCIIPDENGVDQTLVVGAYTDGGYNSNDGPDTDSTMQFSLLSTSRLATPPVFSLSFNVSDGPPTTVSCTANNNGISTEVSRVIVNGPRSITRVTVTVRLSEAGNYQCTVSNDRVAAGTINGVTAVSSTSSLSIGVSGTPTGFNATRLSSGLAHVRLSWSTVSGATGYEVYYQLSSNAPVSIGNTTDTTVDITSGLSYRATYTFYVVSYVSNDSTVLPSENSSTILTFSDLTDSVTDFMATDITSTTITLSWSPPTALVPISYDIDQRCKRVCESLYGPTENDVSIISPHHSTGITPYTECAFNLIGVYGADIANLNTIYLATTLFAAPTVPVSDITFSSVESVSMIVSWNEVPCNGRNGPITGYYLTYTNITSNTSYTVNITGGNNRMYTLTGLIPYTSYTVSIIPYNYNEIGPVSANARQQTLESVPSAIDSLTVVTDYSPYSLGISWSPPTTPNGIITVYEIRYRESTSTGPYNITNTTNAQYSIVGLIPNTSYTIGVRAYTIVGPGEWTDITEKTPLASSVHGFMVIPLNASSVYVSWTAPTVPSISHYTVYYNWTIDDVLTLNLSNSSTSVIITDLTATSTQYEFRISVTIGKFEGPISAFIRPELVPPNVAIAANGAQTIGVSCNMTCTVNVLDLLVPNTMIQWVKTPPNNTIQSPITANTTSIHYIEALNTSDAGLYTCIATISIPAIGLTVQGNDSHVVILKIPQPTVIVSLSRETDLLAGSSLNITCSITIDPRVNTPVNITTEWSPIIMPNRVIIDNVNHYQSVLYFTSLSSIQDGGIYQCSVNVTSLSDYVTQADSTSNTTTLIVTNPMIENFSAFSTSIKGSCLASDPYVTCTASKPTIVLSDLILVWTHNGTIRNGTVSTLTTSDTTTVTNTLSYSMTYHNTYRCNASLYLPNKAIYNITEITATINFQSLPNEAVYVSASTGPTTANVTFTIPTIAYTPENYSISYVGHKLQTIITDSMTVMSSSNISATNERYCIMLSGLEEDNTYSFVVISTNCIGSTNTSIMNFTTLPDFPTGAPLNCRSTNIQSDSVDLNWAPPEISFQNGRLMYYNINCSQIGQYYTNSASQLMWSFTGLSPYTSYSCDVSAVNVVGEGPATACSFTTAQDIPFDSPKNFTSAPNKTFVSFSWMGPVTPNGIIIEYNLTVVNLNTGNIIDYIVDANPNQEIVERVVSGFSPYQNYTASVSASTIIGAGPVATTTGRTLPDTLSSPNLVVSPVIINSLTVAYTVPVLNDTAINVTWSPPSYPNRDITGYIVRVGTIDITSSNNVPFVPNKVSYTLIFGGLRPRVPYYISVAAINLLGEGNSAMAIAFTKAESSVSASPSNVQAIRIGDTIQLSWGMVSLEEAKGFFVYSIRLTSEGSSGGNALRQTNTRTLSVPFSVTAVNITDIDPQLAYTVSISVSVLSAVGIVEGPAVQIILTESPTNGTNNVGSTSPTNDTNNVGSTTVLLVSVIVPVIIVVTILILIIVCITCIVTYNKRKSMKLDLSKPADDVNVGPNIGYGLVNIAKASVTHNEDAAYERIDDCLYEQIDDKPVQEQQANTPVVGGSVDDIAITSCPAYETTATESIAHQELDETPQNH